MNTIDFGSLESISNVKASPYDFGRNGNKFSITKGCRTKLGLYAETGIIAKATTYLENGKVFLAAVTKTQAENDELFAFGGKSSVFTGAELARYLDERGLNAEKYILKFTREYEGVKYYEITPYIEEDSAEEESPIEMVDEIEVEESIENEL